MLINLLLASNQKLAMKSSLGKRLSTQELDLHVSRSIQRFTFKIKINEDVQKSVRFSCIIGRIQLSFHSG